MATVFGTPISIRDGEIMSGHMRALAASELGCPVWLVDADTSERRYVRLRRRGGLFEEIPAERQDTLWGGAQDEAV